MRIERIVLNITVLVALFMVPWWGVVAIIIVLVLYFLPYYEAIIFGLLLDAVYILRAPDSFSFGFPFTFLCVALVILSLYAKDRMRLSV